MLGDIYERYNDFFTAWRIRHVSLRHENDVGRVENMAGDRMRSVLEKLTKNRLAAVGVGAGVTAVIQSSSATTVMVVGFVNAGLMTLLQATGVIMGANIGTTITAQLIAFKLSDIAPLYCLSVWSWQFF
jgi:Na+/phosphate symporter